MGESPHAAGVPVTAATTAQAVAADPAPAAAGAKPYPDEPGARPRKSADPSRPPERWRAAATGRRRATVR